MTRLSGLWNTGSSGKLDFTNPVLQEVFTTHLVTDTAGHAYPLYANISVEHANALYRTIKTCQPQVVIEIGMAYGISALAILSALADSGGNGSLISIDPEQSTGARNIGILNVQRSGLIERHRLIEEFDYLALPPLLKDRLSVDFAYVDGWHTFDYTLLDFFYIDKMLNEGGIVAFNDCSLPAVNKVLRFAITHRKYRELNVGLKPSYLTRNIRNAIRNVFTLTSKQDRYFQKQAGWEPAWDFFVDF
jgi:predicted O-methyltransferase YrrM